MAKGHKCDGRTVKGKRGLDGSGKTSSKKGAKGASGFKTVSKH